jgi:site-specific DNA-methyltransferase (adenine-specific)
MKITDKITITNEDNMELMARYPDNYFDFAIVDIEYGIGASKPSIKPNKVIQTNGKILNIKQPNYKNKDWDLKKSSTKYFKELFRVSKKQIIFGGNYYGLSGGYLIWDKLNGESDQYNCELAWLSFTQRTDLVYYLWRGMFQGIEPSQNIMKAIIQQGNKQLNETRIHPTQKPVALYKWLLDKYAKQGDKILDTHGGSCSLAIACHDYGFELTCCELDVDYYNKAIERVKNHVSQLKLF